MNSSPWRLEGVDGGDEQYPVESRFAVDTPLLMNRTLVLTVGLQHKSVSSILRYARRLPINRIPFRTWPVEHKVVSSILWYARPRFHRLFCPSPSDEHDHAFRSDPADWLSMNTTSTLFLHFDPAMYVCAIGVRDPARMYVRGRIFFLAPSPMYVCVHATCAPLL